MSKRILRWEDLTFPPINLWTAPHLQLLHLQLKVYMVSKDIVLRLNQIHSMTKEKVVKVDHKCNRKCSLNGDGICISCKRHIDEIVAAKQ